MPMLLGYESGSLSYTFSDPFACAAYYPIEVLALDHIGPLVIDEKGHQ